jgi:DNA-3-methyladenine glycosylase I
MSKDAKNRCEWCLGSDVDTKYHDKEWGMPVHNDKKLFEFLILEGAQAGLSWRTILNRRTGYKEVFDGFDFNKCARYTDKQLETKLKNIGIIRNRLKVFSVRKNALAFLEVRKEFGTFSKYLWSFVGGEQIQNKHKSMSDFVATTAISDKLAKDLKKRGFSFVGSTIMYAYMQAMGLVNDHVVGCFRYKEI